MATRLLSTAVGNMLNSVWTSPRGFPADEYNTVESAPQTTEVQVFAAWAPVALHQAADIFH